MQSSDLVENSMIELHDLLMISKKKMATVEDIKSFFKLTFFDKEIKTYALHEASKNVMQFKGI